MLESWLSEIVQEIQQSHKIHWICVSSYKKKSGGARGVIVNEHGDMSSNPGRDWLHFT